MQNISEFQSSKKHLNAADSRALAASRRRIPLAPRAPILMTPICGKWIWGDGGLATIAHTINRQRTAPEEIRVPTARPT
jgi:hypothetical protein